MSSNAQDAARLGQTSASKARIEICEETLLRLDACGALVALHPIDGVGLETLDDSYIHPIFARKYWLPGTITDKRWQMMRPALVLASFLIWEETELFDCFVKILYAPRTAKPGNLKQIYLEDLKITNDLRMKTADQSEEMATVARFYVSRNSGNLDEMEFQDGAYGATQTLYHQMQQPVGSRRYRGPSRGCGPSPQSSENHIYIWIKPEYFSRISEAG